MLGIRLLSPGSRRLAAGLLHDVLGPPGEHQLIVSRRRYAPAHHPHHGRLHLGVGHAGRPQRVRRAALLVVQESEQDVLGADVAVAQLTRLVVGTEQGLFGARCEVLGQSAVSCLSRAASTDFRLA